MINDKVINNIAVPGLEEKIDLQRYWYIIRRRYWVLIATFVVVVLSTVVYTFRQEPIYQATTTLLIEPDFPQVVEFSEVSQFSRTPEFYETQFKIINSRSVVKNTIDILGLSNDPESEETGDPVKAFQGRITIEPEPDTRLVNVSVDNPDPEAAANEVNTLARAYIQYNLGDRRASSKDAFTWLSEQLAVLKAKVKQSEMKLLEYKEEEDIVSLERRQALLEERISETNENYINAVTRRIELETMLNEIENLKQLQMAESLPKILENSLVQQLKQEHSMLELQLAKISKKYKPKHPNIIRLQSQIDNIKDRLSVEVEKIVKSIEIETRISEANENIIKNNLDNLKHESMRLAQQAIHYGVLKREAESNRNMYDVLLHRLKETDISGSVTANNIRVVDEAIVPLNPVTPDKMKNVIMSVIIGIGLGIGFCFLFEYLDNTIKTEEDVKLYLHESLLELVPKNKSVISVKNNEFNEINRSYREMKTTISFYSQEHVLNTLLVTSSVQEEGKTTTVYWLGNAFAQSGSKVLLIDADLFKPKLHKLFQLDHNAGLSDFYLHNKDINEIIIKTEIPNLSIISAGLIPPNPAEIIGSQKMKTLIESVKKNFDVVIIDSPPVTAALEVAALGNFTDGIAVVVKAHNQSWQIARKAITDLKSLKGNVLGVILTSVKHTDRSSYYYYSKDHA